MVAGLNVTEADGCLEIIDSLGLILLNSHAIQIEITQRSGRGSNEIRFAAVLRCRLTGLRPARGGTGVVL